MSDTSNLATALAKAQAAMAGAKKDSTNPHFKNKYADLASVWEACRKALTENGLSVIQFTKIVGDDRLTVLVTRLLHVSGEAVEGELPLPAGKNMQEMGSALTYARRYGLSAMVGVAPEDDDGNAASARPTEPARVEATTPKKPAKYDEWRTDLDSAADNGTDALRLAWTAAKQEYRDYFTATEKSTDAIKARAARASQVPA